MNNPRQLQPCTLVQFAELVRGTLPSLQLDHHENIDDLAGVRLVTGRQDRDDGKYAPIFRHRVATQAQQFDAILIVPVHEDSLRDICISTGWNGSGGPAIIPQLGHNNYFYPRDIVDDIRAEKQFTFNERYRLQVFLQAFNVANHQNVTSVNTPAYKLSGGVATYQANFGTVSKTNNSGFSSTPRQLELSTRFFF